MASPKWRVVLQWYIKTFCITFYMYFGIILDKVQAIYLKITLTIWLNGRLYSVIIGWVIFFLFSQYNTDIRSIICDVINIVNWRFVNILRQVH